VYAAVKIITSEDVGAERGFQANPSLRGAQATKQSSAAQQHWIASLALAMTRPVAHSCNLRRAGNISSIMRAGHARDTTS
jgi:hypothetical protein